MPMFMESLVGEVRTLARRFTSIEAASKAEPDGDPVAWHSARGMLDLVIACNHISELSSKIAKAGYRECEKEMLEEIGAQSRRVLYNASDIRRSMDALKP
jgi:hypothetical protein